MEIEAEKPNEAGLHQTIGQQFSRSQTLAELLSASNPNQCALVKLLAVANRHGLSPAPLVRSLSQEIRSSVRLKLDLFANELDAGAEPINALEAIDGLLTPSTVLALRLARDSNTLPQFYSSVLQHSSEFQRDSANPNEGMSKATSLFLRWFVVVNVLVFIMLKIVPEFQKMFEEFGVELPIVMRELMRFSDFVVKFWFLFPLVLIPILYWFGSSFIRNLNPGTWRRRRESPGMQRRRALALVTESRSPSIALATINACQPLKRFFKRLINANARIVKGGKHWDSLAAENIISSNEAEALSVSSNPETQAWLLRWSASARRDRADSRYKWSIAVMFAIGNIALAALVFAIALSIFMSLIQIMEKVV